MSERASRRGNPLDLFLVFLILFSVLGAFFRWYSLRQIQAEETDDVLVAEIVLRDADPHVAECLTVGERVWRASGEYFGELIEVAIRPSRITRVEGGVSVEGEWDPRLRCDLYLSVRFSGRAARGRILHGGTQPLSVGQNMTLYTERAELRSLIVKLQPMSDRIEE